ncbi:sugar 3,4-ketoisomerase [Pandoraea sp. NPDC087047]|uniref:sugar 3,4-ketoisomerase n=1 Tax=Pandoraea sp. NPDC087047 TaxID=3364390 RepID=UPI0037F57217
MKRYTVLDLATFSDDRGSLTVLDNVLPFPIARTYWIYGAGGQTRGGHRHHVTRQALIAISGTVSVYMDDGIAQATVQLDKPNLCLLVEPKDWHTMTFGENSVLLVVSSHHYDRNDYIDQRYD